MLNNSDIMDWDLNRKREYGDCVVSQLSLDAFEIAWRQEKGQLNWNCLFVLPPWLKAWWRSFGDNLGDLICAVHRDQTLLGIAPLCIDKQTAFLIGNTDVCDYLDVVVKTGEEHPFFSVLLADLKCQGIRQLDLGLLRPDSAVLSFFNKQKAADSNGVIIEQVDFLYEMDLPDAWEKFLLHLNGKQRHEVRRKLRRLKEAAAIDFQSFDTAGDVSSAMEMFFSLFRSNRPEKSAFMNGPMRDFFRCLAQTMSHEGFLSLHFLQIAGSAAASAICFEYQGTTYLYNNGYDQRFESLSVGQLTKVLTIKDSIAKGQHRYNFLKGREVYKKRLGGQPVPLYRCRVTL
ncbi:MAG: GNAT family N-acetyltransferase [Desulfobacterales bacterium]|nr:GNAT family N-acetyltransferase [Desulfobacterales bacterium]